MAEGGGIGLSVRNLTVRYAPGHAAADDVSFDVDPGEFFVLVGPSGCGKSTVLRSLAGLVRPERGRVVLGGRTVTDLPGGTVVPSSDRHLGLVFQSYALWPHMTVEENVRFPLEARGVPREHWRDLVRQALERVSLAPLAQRPVPSLSGGQQQRVALARALVSDPPVILLDEPLSNLDGELRRQMRVELKTIQREVGATIVHVTHDREEAMELADRLAVMRDGRLLEVGGPEDLYRRPAHAWTAGFLGDCSVLPGSYTGDAGGKTRFRTALGELACSSRGPRPAGAAALVIRAEEVEWLSPGLDGTEMGDGRNRVSGRIVQVRYLGSRTLYRIESGSVSLWASSTTPRGSRGDAVAVHLPPDSCFVVEWEEPGSGVLPQTL
ncbi:MAG: ABC transporter ATP-binding protein [Gemmatimonadetes bacterium]|nr:ABC transporter ATP-binding protein [Gemmatimonadota bacterium]